jgi:hypothetical protein
MAGDYAAMSDYSAINSGGSLTLRRTSPFQNGDRLRQTISIERTLVMKLHKKARAGAMLRQHRRLPLEKVMIHVPLRAADAKRSVKNILQWNCYLPCDCVRTMVRMGWDYTT